MEPLIWSLNQERQLVVNHLAPLTVSEAWGDGGEPKTETLHTTEVPQAPVRTRSQAHSHSHALFSASLKLLSAPLRTGSYCKMQNVTPSVPSNTDISHVCIFVESFENTNSKLCVFRCTGWIFPLLTSLGFMRIIPLLIHLSYIIYSKTRFSSASIMTQGTRWCRSPMCCTVLPTIVTVLVFLALVPIVISPLRWLCVFVE